MRWKQIHLANLYFYRDMKRHLFLGAFLMVGFAQAQTLTAEAKTGLIKTLNQRVTQMAFVPGKDFSNFPSLLETLKPRVEAAITPSDFAAVLNEALARFGVSHMSVITPDAARARATGGTVGIGIQLEVKERGIKLLAVYPRSPAEKAGLKPGETIIAVDGVKPTSRDALAGEAGKSFKLTVVGLDGQERSVTITKAFFSTREPESLRWHNSVAILRIPTFDGFARQGEAPTGYDGANVDKLIKEAIAKKAKYAIVDVRNNPGGVVLNMLSFAGYFIPSDVALGSFVNRTSSQRFVKETGNKPDDLEAYLKWDKSPIKPFRQESRLNVPVAVLVNGGTGSAAEMIAAGLRDAGGARVFGQKSIGMVLASVISSLDPLGTPKDKQTGFQVIVPIQDYITAKGLRLEGHGVKPDVPITSQVTNENDPVLKAALAWIATGPKVKTVSR